MKILFTAILYSLISLQGDITSNISQALKAGSSKELIKYCNTSIEVKINGKGANYSLSQAEEVLKNFSSQILQETLLISTKVNHPKA